MMDLTRYRSLAIMSLPLLLWGCSNLGYYVQAIDGHAQLLHRTSSIETLLRGKQISAAQRARLQWVLEVRAFASRELTLPENDSYRSFAALDGEAVAWSLVATPEFAMEPLQWCFPLVGCADYRAYFAREDADGEGQRLEKAGRDWAVEPVAAYSTLGWMDDPLPSTVLHWPEPALAGLIFHELAHQQLYVKDDSSFNEAFATVVERAGVRRWLKQRGDREQLRTWEQRVQREQELVEPLLRTRARLQALYARPLPIAELRRLKREEIGHLRAELQALAQRWGKNARGLELWLARPLNNARLALVGTYEQWVPAFKALLAKSGGDFSAFYQTAAELGKQPPELRRQRLSELSSSVGSNR